MENAKDIIIFNLKILPEYCVNAQIDNVIECLFSDKWIRTIIERRKYFNPVYNELFSLDEILSHLQLDKPISDDWHKYLIQILPKKDGDIFPLPRKSNSEITQPVKDLAFPELLHYVSVTNLKNLWNDSYSNFSEHAVVQQWRNGVRIHLEPYNKVLRDALQRLYRCPLISLSNDDQFENDSEVTSSAKDMMIPNIHPALCIIEGIDHFFIVMEPSSFSVFHCLNFSPSKLQECETGSLFLLYQLLEAFQAIHELGLFIGNISLHNLRLDSDFHLTVIPCIYEFFQKPEFFITKNDHYLKEQTNYNSEEFTTESKNVFAFLALVSSKEVKNIFYKHSETCISNCNKSAKEIDALSLLQLAQLWATHEINNFDYLLSLSYFAGHSFDSPLHYPTLPWVTDFTSPVDSWRDLTKSKYRLNKGDQQLNHTYELLDTDGHQEQIAHHIPEFFSEVTYYVYKARVTPKQILQKYVRQQFVPSHYPVSIARMYALTPEECIPEFYCDPDIFKSIHGDLPDLEVPSWCSGVHDFIHFHRQALESNYVSRRLHHWIDLYYGCKLSGNASVKAKNVCLPLVDGHANLMRGGIVQLFNIPHPPKLSPSPFLSKFPPPPCRGGDSDNSKEGWVNNPSQSMKSFSLSSQNSATKEGQPRQNSNNFIELPQNYNPLTALNQLEMLYTFSLKLSQLPPLMNSVQESDKVTAKQVALLSRTMDMKVLACLIVQIFCPLRCRILNPKSDLTKRFEHTLTVYQEPNNIPNSLHYFLNVIFDLKNEDSPKCPVTYRGLPPPTCYQLLHPLFGVVSFPVYFGALSLFVKGIKSYFRSLEELRYLNDESSNEGDEDAKNITERYVSKVAKELKYILPLLSVEGQKMILPHVTELFRNPISAVCAAWKLTDIVLQFFGRTEVRKSILPLLIKLFESEVVSKEHCKLFQQEYLLQLMVRLGLKTFLAHFVTPIIEAVGEYKICIDEANQHPMLCKLSPNLKNADPSPVTYETLEHNSPEEEESGLKTNSNSLENFEPHTASIRSPSGIEADITDAEIDTEMFIFDGEELEDDTTVEDYEGALLNVNSHSRTSLVSDTESCDECSIQEEINERSSVPSPISPTFSGDADIIMNTDSTGECLKGEYNQVGTSATLGLPIPGWRIPEISSAIEFSRSLPENEKHLHLSVFQHSSEEDKSSKQIIDNEHVEVKFDVELTLSDVCCENVLWLSHKLGPVLTARHLTRNLLRMLTLCYAPESGALDALQLLPEDIRSNMSITGKSIVGDKSAAKVLFCLLEIAELYGEQVILVQYLSHITELVGWCGSKFSSSQEGGLIGAMSLLQHLLLRLSDTTFMDHLQETLIRNAVYPVIRLLSSLKVFFPNGSAVRSALAWKVMDSLYIMARRVGVEMSKEKLSPAITRFLTAFQKTQADRRQPPGVVSPISMENTQTTDFGDTSPVQDHRDRNLEELKQVFTPEMAYLSYVPFCKFLGSKHMEDIIPYHELLRSLCLQYDESNQSDHAAELTFGSLSAVECHSDADSSSKFQQLFGADVAAVTGNRIDIKDLETPLEHNSDKSFSMESNLTHLRNSSFVTADSKRHLKGNWLAYWEHEIGRNDQNKGLNLKQIKLQSFIGHTSSVKGIYTFDNENSVMSCSKDKTVKLWSLRSQGDGSAECRAQYTYNGHKKSVFNITFCEPLRLAASCDSTVHIWDPFVGTCLKQLDSLKHSPVTVLCSLNGPSTQLIAATTDYTLKLIDIRTCGYAQEMKITSSSVGLVRCLSTSRDSHLVGVAHSSGVIATLDLRMGQLLATWKPHEGEVLTLEWYEKGTFISSALDQTVSVWSIYDKKFKFSLKGPTEPVHLLKLFEDEIVTGTTANRIGIHSSVCHNACFSSTRLRSETFRGVLTAMEVLPLNRQLLLGADNGSLQLLC